MREQNTGRLTALDVLRGVAVAGMIVVNSPGDWGHAYAPLKHADWNGWTPTDMVFPMFLFGVGLALGLSFPRALGEREARNKLWLRVGRRVIALILLGLFLNWASLLPAVLSGPTPGADAHLGLRLPGVPQRIALCYLAAVVLVLATGRKDEQGRTALNAPALAVAGVASLVIYWALLRFVPVPGFGPGGLDPVGSLTAYIDRAVFTPAHMWSQGWATPNGPVTYDPEGLLSTLPAVFNVLAGVLAGREWRRNGEPRLLWLAGASALMFVLGLVLHPVFPINKRLWTSSFALLSSGFSGLTLVVVVLALRSKLAERWAEPLKALGGNAILAYAISELLGVLGGVPVKGTSPQAWGFGLVRGVIPDDNLASLTCAIGILVIVTAMIWPLHRRAIHFRL